MNQENIQADKSIDEIDAIDADEVTLEATSETTPLPGKAVLKQPMPPIPIGESGLMAPTDSGQLAAMAEGFLRSAALPAQFKNRQQVVMALQYARQIGFAGKELAALRQMTIINGTLSIWGELPKALAEKTGELEYMIEELYDEGYNKICFENKNLDKAPMVSLCKGKRKDKAEVQKTFTWKQAEVAGLVGKNGSLYKIYPHRMMQMRARSLFLKDEFSDALSGIAILEYDHHAIMSPSGQLIAPPGTDTAKNINDAYLDAKEA